MSILPLTLSSCSFSEFSLILASSASSELSLISSSCSSTESPSISSVSSTSKDKFSSSLLTSPLFPTSAPVTASSITECGWRRWCPQLYSYPIVGPTPKSRQRGMKVILSAYPSITRSRRNTRARNRDEYFQEEKRNSLGVS